MTKQVSRQGKIKHMIWEFFIWNFTDIKQYKNSFILTGYYWWLKGYSIPKCQVKLWKSVSKQLSIVYKNQINS